jgi:hypothetical protein
LGHFVFARLAKFAKLAKLGKIQISAVQITTELKRAKESNKKAFWQM